MKKQKKRDSFNWSFLKENSKGQVWIEAVIYTLIAFAMIGIVLAIAKPKIEELQDKAIIEQSIVMMKDIDAIILEITQGGPGNQRIVDLGIKKGVLKIDGSADKILFEIEGRHTYSEPGINVFDGNIIVYTEKMGKLNKITLTRDYSGEYDIKYQNKDESKSISKSPTSHKLSISNEGGDKTVINTEVS